VFVKTNYKSSSVSTNPTLKSSTMERVIIGSSNVYRFYKTDLYKDNYNTYNMVRCTDVVTFKAIVDNLEENESEVVVSVLENFLERSVGDEKSEENLLTSLGESVDNFMKIIKAAAKRNPNSKFAIAEPITRPKKIWYQQNYDNIITAFNESFGFMKLNNVTRIEGIPQGCQQFEADQVHLTEAAGKIFVEGLLTEAEKFFKAPLVDLASEPEDQPNPTATDQFEARLSKLENQVRTRQVKDNLIFARIREEMDTATNKQKEDRVVITGITSRIAPPADPIQKKDWIRNIVTDIFNTVLPEFAGEIIYINQGRSNGRIIPLVEVKLNSVENATLIRKSFAEKKKQGADLGRLFIANCVNLATRVRVDVLKALARKISDQHVVAYALPFVSRPTLQVRSSAAGSADTKTFTYTDAVAKYGHLLKQFELGEAYRRAGSFFKGQLEQQFVILKESGQQTQPQQQQQGHQHQHQPRQRQNPQRQGDRGAPQPGGSRKRSREDEMDEDEGNEGFEPATRGGSGYGRGNSSGFRRPYRGNKYYRR
jgi:hypothetical protein